MNIFKWFRPEEIELTGQLFTKTYQNRYSLDHTGKTYIEKGPQYVKYTGKYDRSKNKFVGFWEIDTTYTFEDGKARNYTSRGHWEMLKISSL